MGQLDFIIQYLFIERLTVIYKKYSLSNFSTRCTGLVEFRIEFISERAESVQPREINLR